MTLAAAKVVGPSGSVVGVDVSEGMLDVARSSIEEAKGAEGGRDLGDVTIFTGDITKLDEISELKGRKFDAITCCSALVLLDSPITAIKHWTTYLKPGGYLITEATHPRNLIDGMVAERTFIRLGLQPPAQRSWSQSADDLKGMCEAAGLVVEDVHLQEQVGFGRHYYEVSDGEQKWEGICALKIGLPFEDPSITEKAKVIFLEEWGKAADKYGAVEVVDGVYVVKARKVDDKPALEPIMRGSCACGKTTWAAHVLPMAICHCYCDQCRKTSGAPFLTMMEFPFWGMSFSPRLIEQRSVNLTGIATRTFCASCGSTIAFRGFGSLERIEISMGTLDEETLREGVGLKDILACARKNWCFLNEKPSYWETPDDGWGRWSTTTFEGQCLKKEA